MGYAEPHSGEVNDPQPQSVEIEDVKRDREVEQVYSSRRAIKVYQAKPSHAPRPTETGPYVTDKRSLE